MYSEQEAVLSLSYARAFLRVASLNYEQDLLKNIQQAALFFTQHTTLIWHQSTAVWQKILSIFSCDLKEFSWLFQLLERHNRLELFPKIFCAFVRLYKQQEQAVFIRVTYSHSFSKEQEQFFTARILHTINAPHMMHVVYVQPNLIAGVLVQSDTVSWECSVRRSLRLYERGVLGVN